MLADTSESDKAWDQGDGAAWRPGVTEGSLTEVPSDSPDGSLPHDEPSGEPTPEESSADALVRSVSEGTELLSAALQSAPYDSDNPYTKVEVGKYAPGTYTVTANLFIPASKNPFNQSIQAYMTNPDNPLGIVEPDNGDPGAVTGGVPIFHVEKNATLTVGEDDSITLTVPIRNPVFTLQGIGSGQGAELLSAHTRAGEYGPRDASGKVVIVGHKSRVDSVTFNLSNSGKTTDGSDGYTIQGCSEYPTILNQNWHVDLDLTVDMSDVPAGQKYAADPTVVADLAYNGRDQQGVAFEADKCVVVSGTATARDAGDYEVTLKPKDGFLWFDGTADERSFTWQIAKAQVTKKYEVVVPCSEDIAETIAALPSAETVNAGFTYEGLAEGDTPESLGIAGQTFDGWDLGDLEYVQSMPDLLHQVVPCQLSGQLSGDNAGTDNYEVSTRAIAHVTMAPGQMPVARDLVYNGTSQLGLAQEDGTPFRVTPTREGLGVTPWEDFTQGWFNGVHARSYVNVGTYSATLSPSEIWTHADGWWCDGTNEPKTLSWRIVPATLTAAARDVYIYEGDSAELKVDVSGFAARENAGIATGYRAPVAVVKGNASPSTLPVGEYEIAVSGGRADNYTFDYRPATLHVLSADAAAVPFVETGLVYAGTEQTGVAAGAGYTVQGGQAKDAGTYTATATLADGIAKWADGSTDRSRTLEWSIAPAKLAAIYESESVSRKDYDEGTDAPGFRVKVTGFVGGERPEEGTVADYVAPELYVYDASTESATDVKATDWKAEFSDQGFIPAGGSAKNYVFSSYAWGELYLFVDDGIYRAAYPYVESGLVYSGAEQTGVHSRAGSTVVSGSSAVNAGTYKATISLDDERTGWNNTGGSSDDGWHGENDKPDSEQRVITAQWSIAKAPLSAKAKDITITLGDTPQLFAEVSGFKGGDTAESAAGYTAPVVSLPEGVTFDTLEAGRSYELSVSGGGADNYTFSDYETGTLTVLPRGTIAEPTVASGLVYTGSEQRAIQENDGWTLKGATATVAGDHETTVTLKDGYTWADGSTAAKTYHWSIARARLTATYRGEEVAEGEAPALRVDVTGFVGGEGPSTAAGYRAPAVSAPSPLAAGSYELAPSGGAADNYEFAYVGGTLAVRPGGLPRPGSLAPGTYAVTANLAMPGQYNPVISGLTVYANSPNNPFGPTIDENDPAEVKNEIPSSPLSMNARLVVSADGARTLVLPIKNPIFTTQELGSCEGLSDVRTERVRPTAAGGDWSGSYNRRQDRIHMMSARLPGGAATGVAEFAFRGSVLYAVPLDRELRPSGDVALRLTVDYSSLRRDSDSTELPAFAKGGDTPRPDPRPGPDNPNKPNNPSNPNPSPNNPSNPNPSPNNPNPSPNNPSNPIPVPNSGKGSGGGISPKDSGDAIRTSNGHLAAGTYTVSANIWVNKATSGLPLQPHFTSAAFPPMNPVSKNATLRVESDGHAYVTVPIVIQSRVMHVLSLTGLDIVRQSYSGEGLSSITVDLGVLRNTDTITKNVTARIRLGSLAKTIIGGNENRTWACTFQVVFNGTSASGGGTIPKAAQDIINAQGKDGRAANSDERARSAADAAMAALDADDGGAAGEDAPAAGSPSAQTTRGRSKGTAEQAAQAAEQLAQGNAGLVAGMVALGIVALGAVAYALHLRRRLKGMGSPPPSSPPSGEA